MKRPSYFLSLFGCESGGLVRACNDCTEDEPNRLVHVAFVKKGATVNETASGLVASLLALETTCDAYIVRNTNGTMAAATYNTGKGSGKQISRVLSGTHSITFIDFDIIDNIEDFWNPSISTAQNYYMYFFTSSIGWAVKSPLSISPGVPITDDITTFIEGSIKIDWSSKGLPLPIKVGADNVNLLEPCSILFTNTVGFLNRSGSMASISSDGLTLSLHSGDSLNAGLSSGSTVMSEVDLTSGSLPTGINLLLSSDGKTIILTGMSTSTGTYSFSVRGINACGVGAEFQVRIIIS
jgi:hypothetical protein